MQHEINLNYLTPNETTFLAFEQINGQTYSIVPREIKGAELRFPVVDDTKMALDLKLLDSLADYKWGKNVVSGEPLGDMDGEKEELRKYIIEFRNAALKQDIPAIFKLLNIPQDLEKIVIEYSMMNPSGNSEEVNSWAQLLCGDDSKDFEVSPYFPWSPNQTLTHFLVEDEFYRPLKQKHVSPISLFLPHLANILNLPTAIINLISGYIDIGEPTPKRPHVVNEIISFINAYGSTLSKTNEISFNVRFLTVADNAISSFRNNPASAFEPMKEDKLLAYQVPIKNPLDILAVLVTQPVFGSNKKVPITLLEHILSHFHLLNSSQIERIPMFFNNVRALYESSYIIAMNKDVLTDEKGELRFTFLPENNLQRNWSLQLLEELRDYSVQDRLGGISAKIRPNLDIAEPYLPNFAFNMMGAGCRKRDRDYDYPVHFPWDINDQKSQRLTDFLIEEKIYGSQTRKDLISRILPVVLPLPKLLLDIIKGYASEVQPAQEWVINQIEAFINGVMTVTRRRNCTYESALLDLALNALKAIRNNSGFEPFEAKISQGPQLPVKNAYDFMTMLVTQMVSSPAENYPRTLFELVINLLHNIQPSVIRQVPEFFYEVKALVDSAYVLSKNIPLRVGFHLIPDMENSLYMHVDRDLKLGDQLQVKTPEGKLAPLNNGGATPVLLMTTLKLLNENVDEKNVAFNGQNGFILYLLKTETCVRLLNYYKRSEALRLVYDYINKPKSLFSLFKNNSDRTQEAKDLASRLVNTPHSEYSLINEIGQLSLFETSEPYATVLQQVRVTLENDQRCSQTVPSFL